MALDSGLEKDSLVAAEGLTCLRLDISKDFWSLSLPLSLSLSCGAFIDPDIILIIM